jgi:hypothetical protein
MTPQLNTHTVQETAMLTFQPVLPAVIEQTALSLFESFSEKMKRTLNGREDRALKMALEGHVTHKAARVFSVLSENGQHAYLVDLDRSFCTCPDSRKGQVCKHRLAAYLVEQSQQANKNQETPANKPETHKEHSSRPDPEPRDTGDPDLEKVQRILQSRSEFMQEAIVYATLEWEGQLFPVEILSLEKEIALVRALPKMMNDKLIPQFPFPGKKSLTQVIANCLSEVTIYR